MARVAALRGFRGRASDNPNGMASAASSSDLLPLFTIHGSLEEYLVRVVEFCRETMQADGVSLFLQIEGTDTYVLASQVGDSADLPWSATIENGKGLAGESAAKGVARVYSGTEPGSRHPGKHQFHSSMVVPLVSLDGDTVGVLNLSRRHGRKPYGETDLQKAMGIARHLALAVKNAALIARHRAEVEKHLAFAEQVRKVLESLPWGVVALDRRGGILQINTSACRLLRHSTESGAHEWADLSSNLSEPNRIEIDKCLAQAAKGKECRVGISESDGRHLVFRAAPGAENGVTVVIEDVTHEVEREKELQRTRTLAEIGRMTSAIAHEVRNPLTSIRGAAQMMRDETSVEAAKSWARVVEQEALELNQLCDAFLDFAKSIALNLGKTDLNSVAADILKQMRPDFSRKGVVVNFRCDPSLPQIDADAAKMGQVLRNLFRNAIDAMPRGGQLSIRTEAHQNCVLIEVADQGIGISEEDLSKLFTPFFTTKSHGTGLGMCNVQRIVEAHGGTVSVKSRIGHGTTVTIELPLNSASSIGTEFVYQP